MPAVAIFFPVDSWTMQCLLPSLFLVLPLLHHKCVLSFWCAQTLPCDVFGAGYGLAQKELEHGRCPLRIHSVQCWGVLYTLVVSVNSNHISYCLFSSWTTGLEKEACTNNGASKCSDLNLRKMFFLQQHSQKIVPWRLEERKQGPQSETGLNFL